MGKSSVITSEFKAIQTALEVLEPLNENQRSFAIKMILSRLSIAPSSLAGSAGFDKNDGGKGGGDGGAGGAAGINADDIKKMTPKDFLRRKKPATDLERLICLAFFLANARDTPHFKTRDITTLNTEAAGLNFSNAAATANNAVNQSRFLSHAGKGKKQLTPLGEDVVNALPDKGAVDQVIADAPKTRRAKSAKKSNEKIKK